MALVTYILVVVLPNHQTTRQSCSRTGLMHKMAERWFKGVGKDNVACVDRAGVRRHG